MKYICYIFVLFSSAYGYDASDIFHTLWEKDNNVIDRVFFMPHDANIVKEIYKILIQCTTQKITGAAFRLSHPDIIHELIEAHKRNIEITIILDPEAMSISKKVSDLSNAGIPLLLCNKKKYGTLMHNKFMIFHGVQFIPDGPLFTIVTTGSLNVTQNGFSNFENVIFRNDPTIIASYQQAWEDLLTYTDRYQLIRRLTPYKKNPL